jgi:hypothetical protein
MNDQMPPTVSGSSFILPYSLSDGLHEIAKSGKLGQAVGQGSLQRTTVPTTIRQILGGEVLQADIHSKFWVVGGPIEELVRDAWPPDWGSKSVDSRLLAA